MNNIIYIHYNGKDIAYIQPGEKYLMDDSGNYYGSLCELRKAYKLPNHDSMYARCNNCKILVNFCPSKLRNIRKYVRGLFLLQNNLLNSNVNYYCPFEINDITIYDVKEESGIIWYRYRVPIEPSCASCLPWVSDFKVEWIQYEEFSTKYIGLLQDI